MSVLVVDSGDRRDSSFYLSKALAIGNDAGVPGRGRPGRARDAADARQARRSSILNDTMLPPGLAGGALKRFVERGGGLLVVVGEHSDLAGRPRPTCCPGKLGASVDRTDGRGGTIGFRDYSHPVFEVFKAPRSGDFSAARVLRYRALEPAPDRPRARALRRWRGGGGGAARRRRPRDRAGPRRSTTRGATSR